MGLGTALFVCGWCFAPAAGIRSLAFVVDGEQQPIRDHGRPRNDVVEAAGGDGDAPATSYRSGFWGLAQVTPRAGREECRLELKAVLDDGSEAVTELARIPAAADPGRPAQVVPAAGPGPLVAICMATYEPPAELFRRQIDSIRAQSHRNWVCVISDDCSDPERFEAFRDELGDDPRFVVSRSPSRLGFYRNFERALSLAPPEADFVAMSDQDDVWHEDKLETLLGALGGAQLVYSDARVVERDGTPIADTYWAHRDNNHTSLTSLLAANSVTGAASLFPRELLDYALPFPPEQFGHFHDHWVAATALSLGEIAFVDRPLYDYVQHDGAVLGHAAANRMPPRRSPRRYLSRGARERVRGWRLGFFVDGCRLMQFATILRMRCGERAARPKRRALDRFARADRSPLALAGFALGIARELGRRTETLGAELGLFFAFFWRWLLVASDRGRGRSRIDAQPPDRLVQRPGRRGPETPRVRVMAEKIAPLALAVADDAPERVNLLIPTIDLKHFFGGYLGKLNLAKRLAERGARVRIVTVDPVPPLPSEWKREIESYSGLAGLFERVDVVFGREATGIEVSRSDRFVASTWWSAQIAGEAVRSLGGGRFLYLIQEYEPFTFPMGSYAALADESYRLPHFALFSTELLRDYFRRHGIGVYAGGTEQGDRDSAAFQNAITAVEPPTAAELAARQTRRLLFYARPEEHAARNLFELGLLALGRAVEEGAFQRGWELNGIGTVGAASRIELGAGTALHLAERSPQDAYAELLREHDVGLALMYTPHPSLVPIEMASAGMVTVTNSFENKTAAAMSAISGNLLTVEPDLHGIVAGLRDAVARAEDFEGRARDSRVSWSRDWAQSFDDPLLERVEGFLAR